MCIACRGARGYPLPQAEAVVSASVFHRPVSRGKADGLPLISAHCFGCRLCPRLLLHENEFTPFQSRPARPSKITICKGKLTSP